MNLIDVDALKEKEQYIPCGNRLLFHGVTAATVDAMPTIAPETLPIVQKLQAEVANLKDQLSNLEYWQLNREIVLESAAQDRAAVNVMRKRCEKTIAELRAELKQVKAEREAALADLEYTACCETCAHGCDKPGKICYFCDNRECTCKTCAGGESWKWRGIASENAEEENDQS